MSGIRKTIYLLLALLVATVLIAGQIGCYFAEAGLQKSQTEATSTDDTSSQSAVPVLRVNDAVSQVVQVQLNQVLYFICSIDLREVVSVPFTRFIERIPIQVYLETLLQRIISPNAP